MGKRRRRKTRASRNQGEYMLRSCINKFLRSKEIDTLMFENHFVSISLCRRTIQQGLPAIGFRDDFEEDDCENDNDEIFQRKDGKRK